MNIGIVIHSNTGNTEYVANKIKEVLKKKDHNIDYKKLQLVSYKKSDTKIKEMPDLSSYDAIIFGSHVEAFSLEAVIKAYLDKIEDISGKKVVCLTTQGLPFKWMGANNALKQMSALVKAKGGDVIATEDVSFSNHQKREGKILETVQIINELF